MTVRHPLQDNIITNQVCMFTKSKASPVALSNQGAKLILEGRLEEALKSLEAGLRISKTVIARDMERRNRNRCHVAKQRSKFDGLLVDGPSDALQRPHPSVSSQHEQVTPLSLPPRQEASHPSRMEEKQGVCSTSHENRRQNVNTKKISTSSYIFTDPIILEEHLVLCLRHRECAMKLTAIITFNMGLAHHLLGRSIITTLAQASAADFDMEKRVDLKKECMNHFKRAIAFYTLSCRIQIVERVFLDQIIAMAQLNNLAQIHETLGNLRTSKLLFERLLSNLVLYTESIRNKDNQEVVRRRLAGFHRNTTPFILGGPKVAPAA